MRKILINKLPRISKNKKRLEKELDIKISNRGKEIFIEGSPEKEHLAEKVLEALDFGFPYSAALSIQDEEFLFEKLKIKEHTNRKNMESIKARIIGPVEQIENAQKGIISLIQGSKQGNVYAYLEKHQPKPEPDLGLK